MKSYLTLTLAIVESVLADVSRQRPELLDSMEWDLSYLRRVVEHRGLGYFTITLPDYGKWFDKSLASGDLSAHPVPIGIRMCNGRPRLFAGLLDLVFDTSGMLRDDPDVGAVYLFRQVCYLAKKLRLQCPQDKVIKTVESFIDVDSGLPSHYPNTWDVDHPTWSELHGHPLGDAAPVADGQTPSWLAEGLGDSYFTKDVWDGFRRICRYAISHFGEPDWWTLRPKHGPGVVAEGIRKGSKYNFPTWPERLENWFPYDWFGSGIYNDPYLVPTESETVCSRLIAVPKTQKGPRLICAEPTAHQYMQQAMWRWIEEAVQRSPLRKCIDFRSQEHSRERALDASLSGAHATVDLSEASDRISTRLVHYVFQGSPILDGLHATRTTHVYQDLVSWRSEIHQLNKFSTMGSAVTFPVQTIVFALVAITAVKLVDGSLHTLQDMEEIAGEIRVFGDDIIIPARAYQALVQLLTHLGLKVNTDKSFSEGFFREACGMDAFMGHDVSPAYYLQTYDGSPSSMAAVVEASNNFHKKGMWLTAETIAGLLPPAERKLLRVCGPNDGAFGLWSFVGTYTSHLRGGWCSDLHLPYSISLDIVSKTTKERGQGFADLTQYFVEEPDDQVNWSAGTVRRTSLRKSKVRVYG